VPSPRDSGSCAAPERPALAGNRRRCSSVRPQQQSGVRELRATWRLLSSCRSDKGRQRRQVPRLRPPPVREIDAAARHPLHGFAVFSVTPGSTPNDVFQATRLTLRPWITGVVRARARRPLSYVEGFWSPFLGRRPDKSHAKAHAALPRSFQCQPRIFLSQAGPRFDLTLVQAEHHLWFGLG
jgi:hypothetical protein